MPGKGKRQKSVSDTDDVFLRDHRVVIPTIFAQSVLDIGHGDTKALSRPSN